MSFNFLVKALVLAVLFLPVVFGHGSFVDPEYAGLSEKQCGTLYSETNYKGNAFEFKDFDQSVNTKRDSGSSTGWWNTSSAQVEVNCSINICTGTYFQGVCRQLSHGDHYSIPLNSTILSANCTCIKECRCEHIFIPKYRWGRAYLEGGCKTCNAEYIELASKYSWFPKEYNNSVEAFTLRKGCTLTIYSEENYEGESRDLNGEIVEDFSGPVGSYQFECNDDKFVPCAPPQTNSDLLIQLPASNEKLLGLFSRNDSLATHPAIQAALQSFESGRSPRNVYILLIGSKLPIYFYFDSRHYYWCSEYSDQITECKFSVSVEKLGIASVQVRIIHAQIGDSNDTEVDYRMMASLDEYLLNHEDLKDSIPNAVMIFHEFNDQHFSESGSTFQRKLKAVNALRPLVVDNTFSNVIFLLYKAYWTGKYSETKLEQFEKFLEDDGSLPLPIHAIPAYIYANVPKVNGHWKLRSGEYFPRNLHKKLLLISQEGGDPLGNAILTALFQNQCPIGEGRFEALDLLPTNHCKVNQYRELLTNPLLQQNLSNYFKRAHNKHRRLTMENGEIQDLDEEPMNCKVLEKVVVDIQNENSTDELKARIETLEERLGKLETFFEEMQELLKDGMWVRIIQYYSKLVANMQ